MSSPKKKGEDCTELPFIVVVCLGKRIDRKISVKAVEATINHHNQRSGLGVTTVGGGGTFPASSYLKELASNVTSVGRSKTMLINNCWIIINGERSH